MMMKRALAFAAVTALITLGGAWAILALHGGASTIARTIWVSAALALVVQVGAFFVIWPIVTKNPVAGWGVGSLIRFATLLVYAFVGVNLLGLESGPALISFAGFLFVTMLVEPFFLKR